MRNKYHENFQINSTIWQLYDDSIEKSELSIVCNLQWDHLPLGSCNLNN